MKTVAVLVAILVGSDGIAPRNYASPSTGNRTSREGQG